LIGEVIAYFKGKITGVRVLSGGKIETSEQGLGSILGTEATWLATSVSTPMSNGILMGEGDALVTTKDGEVVIIRKIGIGWSTGRGRKANRRGGFSI